MNLSLKTRQRLKKYLPSTASFHNPLDIVGDASALRYRQALEALLSQRNIGGVIIVQTVQIVTEVKKNARMIIELQRKFPQKPRVFVALTGKLSQPGIDYLEKYHFPCYSDPQRAVRVMKALSQKN